MTEHNEGAATEQRLRAFTWKSLGTGLILLAILAVVIPWNDWALRNTQLYNNYLPPVVTIAILILVLLVNPWLGRYRYRRGELVVVAVMLLALGGVVSGSLVRYLPGVFAGPSRLLADSPAMAPLRESLTADQMAAAKETARTAILEELKVYDTDQSGRVEHQEYPKPSIAVSIDTNADGALSADEVLTYRAIYDDSLLADWRWTLPTAMTIGIPPTGPIDTSDPEFQHVVDGYFNGLPTTTNPDAVRVVHRSVVTWIDQHGVEHGPLVALSGAVRDEFRVRGEPFLDLDDAELGHLLRHRRLNETVPVDDGALTVLAIQPPGIPWYAWTPVIATWAPLLLGGFIAMIAMAGIVRHQWLHNERLPYPIAAVTMQLLEEPDSGRRLPPIFYNKGFWVATVVTIMIITWRGMFAYSLVPINIATSLDVTEAVNGKFLYAMPGGSWMARPTLWFSIVGMAYFMSLQISFSLWFTFIAANLLFGTLIFSGVPLERSHFDNTTVGGFGVMALVIIWLGRKYYWQMLKAAVGLNRDPAARAAAPYLWALMIGGASMVGFLVWQGGSFGGSILLFVIFIGILLVLSRIVAESGMPFCQSGSTNRVSPVLFTLYGMGIPPGALMPLGLVGAALAADNREALMPYVTNATAMGDRAKIGHKRLSLVILIAASVGCTIAFFSMVWAGYRGGGAQVDIFLMWMIEQQAMLPVATITEAQESVDMTTRFEASQSERFMAYGVGAALVALLGWARMSFSWWPLHPIGVLMVSSWCTRATWACLLVGWLWKALVMRYGGTRVYNNLKPVAIGLIAGEAIAAGSFMIIGLIAQYLGHELPEFRMLPR